MLTFQGDLIVLQDLYFDRNGKLLKKTIEFKDLTTKKPKKPSKDSIDELTYLKAGVDYFKSTKSLPFAHPAGLI